MKELARLELRWSRCETKGFHDVIYEVAALLGLEFVVLSTNLRDPAAQLLDYVEMHGVGLAFMGLSLAGRLRRGVPGEARAGED